MNDDPLTEEKDTVDKIVAGSGNDGIVLTQSKPIRGTIESRRKRRDLTEVLQEQGSEDKFEKAEDISEKAAVAAKDDGEIILSEEELEQYTDAEGVSRINIFMNVA